MPFDPVKNSKVLPHKLVNSFKTSYYARNLMLGVWSVTKLVIFDFDGTLVHTAPDIINAVNDFLINRGRPTLSAEKIISGIGMGLRDLIYNVVPESKHTSAVIQKLEDEFLDVYDKHLVRNPVFFDGALDFLKNWPGKTAILSNKKASHIHQILDHLKFKHNWVSIVGGDTFAHKKPHPLPFHEVVKSAGVSLAEAIMVGDGRPDIEGAKAAGITSVGVEFGYSTPDELLSWGASHRLKHFNQLQTLIERLT